MSLPVHPPCEMQDKDGKPDWCISGCERYHNGHYRNYALDPGPKGQQFRAMWRNMDAHRNRPMPSLMTQASNYIASLSEHVANGSRRVPLEVRQQRADICAVCEFRNREHDACVVCGCPVNPDNMLGDKLSWEVSKCPAVPSKWDSWLEDRPALGSGWERAPDVWERFRKMLAREQIRLKDDPIPLGSGDGIVIAGGGKYFPSAYANIRLIRHHGCQLPIELWYLGRHDEMPEKWRRLVEPYGVKCVDADAMRTKYAMRILNGWELKMYAAAYCSFRRLIFLDSDCFPIRDPSFTLEDPRFLGAGAVFQRDVGDFEWIKPEVMAMVGVPVQRHWDIESGAFLVDKQRWGLPMGMTVYLNAHSDLMNLVIYGDKTTPALAAMLTGHQIAMPPRAPGGDAWGLVQYWFDGSEMWQHRIHIKPSLKEENFITPQHHSPKQIRIVTEELSWGPEITEFLRQLRGLI